MPGQVFYLVMDVFRTDADTGHAIDLSVTCERPVCGDGEIGPSEQCDDFNIADGDGCLSNCEVESGYVCYSQPSRCEVACGNGRVNTDLGEACDDMNTLDGDGCSGDCQVEESYVCYEEPSDCEVACGNG